MRAPSDRLNISLPRLVTIVVSIYRISCRSVDTESANDIYGGKSQCSVAKVKWR
jgi:hypothetical protein